MLTLMMTLALLIELNHQLFLAKYAITQYEVQILKYGTPRDKASTCNNNGKFLQVFGFMSQHAANHYLRSAT